MINHIIVNGKAYKCKTYLETLNRFLEKWKSKLEEIKNSALDREQCYHIVQDYVDEAFYYFALSTIELEDAIGILDQLYHEITLAVFISHSRHQKENRKFWNLFWKGKLRLPNHLHIHKR